LSPSEILFIDETAGAWDLFLEIGDAVSRPAFVPLVQEADNSGGIAGLVAAGSLSSGWNPC